MKTKKWIDFLLYSNLFISICAAAITAETYLLIHSDINWLYIIFVFFSTILLYAFPSLFFAEEAFSVNQSERHRWIIENRNTLIGFSVISSLVLAVTVFFFPLKFILLMIPNVVLAFAYFFPQTRLRSITGLKAIIVAFVWTMVTYVYPFLLDNLSLEKSLLGALERFLFLIPICIIFNVRDVEADRIAGVRTIPVIYGVKPSIISCLISLLLFCAFVFFNRGFSAEAIALTASAIITGILILKSSPEKDDYFYSFWIDGMIILQAELIIMDSLL